MPSTELLKAISEQQIKASFIEEELSMLMSRIDPQIKDLRYDVGTGDRMNEEYCVILFSNGYKKKVCITANSLSAITTDVLRAVE